MPPWQQKPHHAWSLWDIFTLKFNTLLLLEPPDTITLEELANFELKRGKCSGHTIYYNLNVSKTNLNPWVLLNKSYIFFPKFLVPLISRDFGICHYWRAKSVQKILVTDNVSWNSLQWRKKRGLLTNFFSSNQSAHQLIMLILECNPKAWKKDNVYLTGLRHRFAWQCEDTFHRNTYLTWVLFATLVQVTDIAPMFTSCLGRTFCLNRFIIWIMVRMFQEKFFALNQSSFCAQFFKLLSPIKEFHMTFPFISGSHIARYNLLYSWK